MSQTAELKLVVGLVDKASGPLGKLGGALSTVGKIGGTALLAGAVAGVGALGVALAGGISDAREAAIVFAQTEAVLASTGGASGKTAEQISELAASLSAASGASLFGDDLIQQSSNLLLTFTNIKGPMVDAATSMSVDMAQALGGAPADAAVQLGKALNDPIAGISALSRVGVTFSDDQKAVIASMVETGNVAGAQEVILAELNKEFGGSAAAAAAADGGMAMFKDRMGELAESIGAQVLPMLNSLMAWLNSPEMQASITAITTGLTTGFSTVMTTIQPVVAFVGENLTPILASVAAMLLVTVVPAFLAWSVAAATAATATIVALAPVLLPIAAVGLAVAALALAWSTDFGGIQTKTKEVWDFIVDAVQPVVDALSRFWTEIQPQLLAAWDTIKGGIETAWNAIHGIITTVGGAIADFITTNMDTIKGIIDGAWNVIKGIVEIAWALISGGIKTGLAILSGDWSGAWESIKTTLSRVWDGIKLVVSGATEIVKNVIRLAWEAVKSVTGAAWDAIKSAIATTWDGIKLAVSTAVDTVKSTISIAWDAVKTATSTTWDTIKTAMTTAIDGAKTAVGTAVDAIKAFFTSGWASAQSTIQGVFDTIGGYISGPIETAQGIVDRIIGAIKSTIQGAIDIGNDLIGLINSIPALPNLPSIPGFASGVQNFSGGYAVVGERGPELVNLPRGSDVYSNQQSRQMMTAPIVVNVYPSAGMNERQLADMVITQLDRRSRLARTR